MFLGSLFLRHPYSLPNPLRCHPLSNQPAMPPLASRTVHLADGSATLPR